MCTLVISSSRNAPTRCAAAAGSSVKSSSRSITCCQPGPWRSAHRCIQLEQVGDTTRSLSPLAVVLIPNLKQPADAGASSNTNTSSSHQHGAPLPGQAQQQQQQHLLAQRLFPATPRHTPTLHRYVHKLLDHTVATVARHECLCVLARCRRPSSPQQTPMRCRPPRATYPSRSLCTSTRSAPSAARSRPSLTTTRSAQRLGPDACCCRRHKTLSTT